MQFVLQNAEALPQGEGLDGVYRQIELAGRTAYKSEANIAEDSAKAFVDRLIEKGHTSVLEHGSVYLDPSVEGTEVWRLEGKPHVSEFRLPDGKKLLSTNYRVVYDSDCGWEKALVDCEPYRMSVRITCSRAISHELVRHRVFSFTQESTRWCNYSKDRFGGKIKCVIPGWAEGIVEGGEYGEADINPSAVVDKVSKGEIGQREMLLICALVSAERVYLSLVNDLKCKPEEARDVLPNALKTELVMTGDKEEWEGFLALRSPLYGAAGVHPDMGNLADGIAHMFDTMGYLPLKETEDEKK